MMATLIANIAFRAALKVGSGQKVLQQLSTLRTLSWPDSHRSTVLEGGPRSGAAITNERSTPSRFEGFLSEKRLFNQRYYPI